MRHKFLSGGLFLLFGLLLSVAIGAVPHPAASQESTTCKGRLAPANGLSFQDGTHKKWYFRFWTGRCTSGLIFCFPGEPSWNEGVLRLVRKHGLQDGSEQLTRLCLVGRRMGHEWARDNSIRTIHTADLEVWMPELDNAANLEVALRKLERRVAARLGN